MKIPIVTQELFETFTDEDIDDYLKGPSWGELTFAVYKTIRASLDENDPGDLGFPEIFLGYLRENHEEQLDEMWDGESEPDYQRMLAWLQEDEERDDALSRYAVKQVYDGGFHYQGLLRFIKEQPDIVVCQSWDEWNAIHMQDEDEEE